MIAPVNDPPVVEDVTFSGEVGTKTVILLKGDDVDGDDLTYSFPSAPDSVKGTLWILHPETGERVVADKDTTIISRNGQSLQWTYEPNIDQCGKDFDEFTYQVDDGTVAVQAKVVISDVKCEPFFGIISSGLKSAAWIVVILLLGISLLCLGFLVHYREHVIMKVSQPIFMGFIIIGCIFASISILFRLNKPTDAACGTVITMQAISFALVFGNLFTKTQRIISIFLNKKLKVKTVRARDMAYHISIIMAGEILIITLNLIIDPPHVLSQVDPKDHTLTHLYCTNPQVWTMVLFGYNGLMMLYGIFLTWQTRVFPSLFNESKYIAVALYNMGFSALVFVPMGFMIGGDAAFMLTVEMVCILNVVLVTLCVLFVPKIWIVLRRDESELKKEFHRSSVVGNIPGQETNSNRNRTITSSERVATVNSKI